MGESVASLQEEFDALQREVFSYQYAQQIIYYDGHTVGPRKGVAARCEAMGELAMREHEAAYGTRAGSLIGRLDAVADELDGLHSDELRVFKRNYSEMGKVPAQEAADFARLTMAASDVWGRAKRQNDYAAFEPYVRKMVESLRRQADYLDPDRDPYEVWLDHFERGLDRATLERFFDLVKKSVVPLVDQIVSRGWQPDDSFLRARIPAEVQEEICRDVYRAMGLDMEALGLGVTEHPFTDGYSHGDVRIANHFYEDNVANALFSAVHEGGHALYEQGIDPAYDYTCLRGGVSMGIHESQSRFMENVIGRSEAFCELLLPILRSHVPGVFDGIDARDLYLAVCKSQPSLIRTEADELTYPLHVMVRYRVESALFDGSCSAHDAPELWNQLMKELLGVTVPDDTHGILQDSHWSGGTFAYFPSYAVGSAYAAQYLSVMSREFDVARTVGSGRIDIVNEWLRERIWRYGSCKDPAWIVRNACGEDWDPTCYVEYLDRKYRAIYGL